jgi:hypothetical protein
LCKAVIIMNEDVARMKSAFEQTGESERSIPYEGHAIVLAWLMLLGPAVVDPSAKHRARSRSLVSLLSTTCRPSVSPGKSLLVILILRHKVFGWLG